MNSGLTATELRAVLLALEAELTGATVRGIALLDSRDDLLIFLETPHGRRTLQVAPGGPRARICTTGRRFPKTAFTDGPRPLRLERLLDGAEWVGATAPAGERRATLTFRAPDRRLRHLEIELFGNRGLWALCEEDATIAALSRLPDVASRALRPGAPYEPPPPPPANRDDPPPRFTPPVLPAVDAFFTALDVAEEGAGERHELTRALDRQTRRLDQRIAGLERSHAGMERADEYRLHADLLLAYAHGPLADAPELRVPDPRAESREIVIPREPGVPPHAQAQALYKRARKAEDGIAICERQLADARGQRDRILALRRVLAATPDDTLGRIRGEFEREGILPRAREPRPDAAGQKLKKATGGENYRRFVSVEGHMIFVGRDNRQNDRLTTRVARGNDIWMHVGRGHAGSHVVVRLPKGKSASLETLLDGGTLAIHFSKVRGAELEEVIYTQAKYVRKPKGLPPGRVVPSRTRTIRVRREPERLERLLSSAGADDR